MEDRRGSAARVKSWPIAMAITMLAKRVMLAIITIATAQALPSFLQLQYKSLGENKLFTTAVIGWKYEAPKLDN